MSDRLKKLDPRRHAYRRDLADLRLKDVVEADYYVAGAPYRVTAPSVFLRGKPEDGAEAASQLRFGEDVRVFEFKNGWAWVQNEADSYVGYIPAESIDLAPKGRSRAATHRIAVPATPIFAGPALKSPVKSMLTLYAAVRVTKEENGWCRISHPGGNGWVSAKHLMAPDHAAPDFAGTALRLLETPYVWGGREATGLDCSGLVQLALNCAGIRDCPRDTDQQRAELGEEVTDSSEPYRRGDLIYMPRHVGIMVDDRHMIHANAHAMKVTVEPLADALARMSAETKASTPKGDGILARRRVKLPAPAAHPAPAHPKP
jgi:cell wall-associated NlpC family hydrolase